MSALRASTAALLLALSASACLSPTPSGGRGDGHSAVARMPFALDRATRRFTGTVRQALPAGGYRYLLVDEDGGAATWVVSLQQRVAAGQRVDVRQFATANDFHSARLARTFDHLVFAFISPAH